VKRALATLMGLALFVAATGCASNFGQTDLRASIRSPGNQVDVSYFHQSLSPYGQWFQDPSNGWCWTPYDVSANWRPYYDGHWEYSDYGWSWASNETWGWAPYHYGRWFFDDAYGWAWVPGTEWAPAWVAWRYGDDCVGWAPLPPRARWDASAGLIFADASAIPPAQWCFVPRTRVLDVNLRLQVTVVARNITLLARSRDVTRFEVRDGRPANVGLDVARIESAVGRRVPRVKIIDVDTPERGRGQSANSGTVGFFRPRVQPAPVEQAPPAAAMAERRTAVPDEVLQRQRDEQQRKLESDLSTERARLARDQKNELRAPGPGRAVEVIRKEQAAEQQAFEAHAVQQRQVLEQRIQKKVVKPGKAEKPGKPANPDKGSARDKVAR
jgi:hypothetical protein